MMSSDKSYLLKYLALPMVVLACISVMSSIRVDRPWSDLLINLAAGFLATIVTVFYIDVILNRQQIRTWSAVLDKVIWNAERVANVSINSIRSAVGIDPAIIDNDAIADPLKRRTEGLRIASIVRLELSRLVDKDTKRWNILAQNLQGASQNVDRLFQLFEHHLNPLISDALLNVQYEIDGFLSIYSCFPDIYGVPGRELPKKRDGSSSEGFQLELYADAVAKMNRILEKSES